MVLMRWGVFCLIIVSLLPGSGWSQTGMDAGQMVEEGRFAGLLQTLAVEFSVRIQYLVTSATRLGADHEYAMTVLGLELTPADWQRVVMRLAVFVGIGLAAEAALRRLLRTSGPVVRHTGGLLGFLAGAFGAYALLSWPPLLELFILTGLSSLFIARILLVIFRSAFPENPPDVWIAAGSFWLIATTRLLESSAFEAGLYRDSGPFLRTIPLLIGLGAMIALISLRRTVWGPALHKFWRWAPSPRSATLWTIGLMLVLMGCAVLGLRAIAAAMVGIPCLLILDHTLVALFAPWMREARPVVVLLRRSLRFMVVLGTLVIFVRYLSGLNLMSGGTSWIALVMQALGIAFIADLSLQAIRLAIERKLASLRPPPGSEIIDEPGGEAGPHARTLTLLPLLRMASSVVILTITIMTILSTLGVDIAPLLAGAGVFGLALGFGAQSLVRDIVSGIFFLIDDAFRVGEYIEVGALKGTVERITLRSLQLRHHRGALNILPYGEIKAITNHSRDWVLVRLEFRLPFDTDVEKVRRIVKRVGLELLEDPEFAPNLLEPLKSQGIRAWEEYGMVIGVKFTARPGTQFVIQRRAHARIRDELQAAGIRFATRRVSVEVADGGDPRAAIAAAATEAANPPQATAKGTAQ